MSLNTKQSSSPDPSALSMERVLDVLRAAGEETRLRILLLLSEGELTVTDLTHVLGQSQPRVSRHLKILLDAGLLERHREGSWTILRIVHSRGLPKVIENALQLLDENLPERVHDRSKFETIKRSRHDQAQSFFHREAGNWNNIRSLHVDDNHVEAAILDVVGKQRVSRLIDLGTGTGGILELLAGHADEAVGFDVNSDMLAYARVQLDQPQLRHCQARYGDLFSLPQYVGTSDLVVLHQVLHFLDDPGSAVAEAGRLLRPGGRILIVDFAPHDVERVRDVENHTRLGFSSQQMTRWVKDAALKELVHRKLPPDVHDDAQHLTVSIWLAERPAVSTLHPAPRPNK